MLEDANSHIAKLEITFQSLVIINLSMQPCIYTNVTHYYMLKNWDNRNNVCILYIYMNHGVERQFKRIPV